MVVIRLARGGTKKAPFYHIVVADRRRSPNGRFIQRLGYFNPMARGQETRLELNIERMEYWISKGAKPSERVNHLTKVFKKQAGIAVTPGETKAEMKKAQQEASMAAAKKQMMEITKKAEAEEKAKTEEAAKAEEPPKEAAAETLKAEEAPKVEEAAKTEPVAEPKAEEAPEAKKTSQEAAPEATADKGESKKPKESPEAEAKKDDSDKE